MAAWFEHYQPALLIAMSDLKPSPSKKLIVGLTGGIGSGKSCVSDRLKQLGATIVDTDVIAHQLTDTGGHAIDSIRNTFGPESINQYGKMDRDFMRGKLTLDSEARRQLESILHPLIRVKAQEDIQTADGCYVVVVVPLLVEKGGWSDWMDEIVVVDCSEESQIVRVEKRNGWPLEQIRTILSIQANREERLKIATEVVTNDGDLPHLLSQTDDLHEKLLLKASKLSNNLQQNDR